MDIHNLDKQYFGRSGNNQNKLPKIGYAAGCYRFFLTKLDSRINLLATSDSFLKKCE